MSSSSSMRRCVLAVAFCFLVTLNLANCDDKLPIFNPCGAIGGLLGLPPASYIPCSLVRGAVYFHDHYRRGLRMLMKNSRKGLSRNKIVNALANSSKMTETLRKLAATKFNRS